MKFQAVAVGCSAGGMQAVARLLAKIGPDFRLPLIVVQHVQRDQDGQLLRFYSACTRLAVQEAEEKELLRPGHVYLAPADYHLLLERDGTFSLSVAEKVNFCRPAIDVFFESAADAFGPALIGAVLTGANNDGALGLKRIQERGGLTLVQRPESAQFPAMPRAALRCMQADHVLTVEEMSSFLASLPDAS